MTYVPINVAVDRHGRQWVVRPERGGGTFTGEYPVDMGGIPDERIILHRSDPRVGRLATWGNNHHSSVYAVIYVDGVETELLLRDWTGYPWVRVPLDAELKATVSS